jgi:hypothetical protein
MSPIGVYGHVKREIPPGSGMRAVGCPHYRPDAGIFTGWDTRVDRQVDFVSALRRGLDGSRGGSVDA